MCLPSQDQTFLVKLVPAQHYELSWKEHFDSAVVIENTFDYLYPGEEIHIECPAVARLLQITEEIDSGHLIHCIHE